VKTEIENQKTVNCSLLTVNSIAITGAGCRFAKTADPQTFWRHTLANVPLLSACPSVHELLAKAEAIGQPWLCPPRKIGLLENLHSYEAETFREQDAPATLFAAQVAMEALRDASLSSGRMSSSRTGLYIGATSPFSPALEAVLQHLHNVDQTVALARNLAPHADESQLEGLSRHLRAGLPPFTQAMVRDAHPHTLAASVAALLKISGPARVACDGHAAFFGALQTAMDDLAAGRVDAAVVGAVTPAFTSASLLAACALMDITRREVLHSFCKSADGTTPGEGAAFFVLQRQGQFHATPYAIVRGVAMGGDLPQTPGAENIGYIEAHGSGVRQEDNAELAALCDAFKSVAAPVAIGTAKPMFGHTLAASGAAGFLRAALALRHRVLPPTPLAGKSHPRLAQSSPLYVPEEPRPWVGGASPRRAGVTALDPTGLCGHAILEESL